MTRRKPYSKLIKENRVKSPYAEGKGDISFRGFQCLNYECDHFIYIQNDDIVEDFEIHCPKCSYIHHFSGETIFFDYKMLVKNNDIEEIIEEGPFTIYHDEYIAEAQEYKYCVICKCIKPMDFFDRHKRRKTRRQSECRLCKKSYNSIKNGTRLADQHREAAQKRRLYLDIAGSYKINSDEIYNRFEHHCFNCNKDLSNVETKLDKPLDHTLPVFYLWPLTTENATLLCRECNGSKSGSWPGIFYSDQQLKRLSILTGIGYNLLSGKPQYNPDAIKYLQNPYNVNILLEKYSAYISEIIRLRNRILIDLGFDFFKGSNISKTWIDKANEIIRR